MIGQAKRMAERVGHNRIKASVPGQSGSHRMPGVFGTPGFASGGAPVAMYVAHVMPDSSTYCAVFPGAGGITIMWLHEGHWICRPENCSSQTICCSQWEQQNLNSAISLGWFWFANNSVTVS
jgi:hypothetical protein